MTMIDGLILDFKSQIKRRRFGDKKWEENSYLYICNILTIAKKINRKTPYKKIMRILKKHDSLEYAYLNIIEFLEGLK